MSPIRGPIRRTSSARRYWAPSLAAADFPADLDSHPLWRSPLALLIAQREHPKVISDRPHHTSVRPVLDVYVDRHEGAEEATAEGCVSYPGATP